MKTLLLAFLSLCFAVGIVAVAQSAPDQKLQKHPVTTIMGTVRENDQTLPFVTDQRTWNVDNPEALKGHEGHYVRVNAHLYADMGSIYITKVQTATASESRENDGR